MRENLKDAMIFLIKCLPVLFVIGYIIFYIAVLVEYKDVPVNEVPTWVAWMLYNRG